METPAARATSRNPTPDQICSDHQPLVQSRTAWTSRFGNDDSSSARLNWRPWTLSCHCAGSIDGTLSNSQISAGKALAENDVVGVDPEISATAGASRSTACQPTNVATLSVATRSNPRGGARGPLPALRR